VIVDYFGNHYPSYDAFLRGRIWKIRRDRWLRDKRPWCRACRRKGRLDVHHLEHLEGMLRERSRLTTPGARDSG
jgi:hypothetical protein